MQEWETNPLSLFDVRGKSIIVTGATGAFGSLAARVLAASGANLTLTGSNQAELNTITDECKALKANVVAVNIRPDSEENAQRIVDNSLVFGSIDGLVVASGMNDVAMIADMSPQRFQNVMNANVTCSWLMARAAGKQMLARGTGGKIVFMSSARGKLGHPAGYSAYCASKAALDGMTRALGCEWGDKGITVNAIAPTVFRSPLTAWMFEDTEKAEAVRKGFLSRVPKGRLGEPSDLAGPLLFLLSPASDFYTGHILYADGGYTAG